MSQTYSEIVYFGTKDLPSIGEAVCAIGAFDGVHVGHRFLIDSMVSHAHELGLPSVIVSFDIDPDELFCKPRDVRKILANTDRIDLLAQCGADYVFIIPFTRSLAAFSAEEFLGPVLGSFMTLRGIHVGADFRLGADNGGNIDSMKSWGASRNCLVEGYDLMRISGEVVTATRIRELLAEGDVAAASAFLGRDHFMRGVVTKGRGEGTELGFPTANVDYSPLYTPVKDGVYAGRVLVGDQSYLSAVNVGVPPTFEEATCALEPHLLDFDGDLYGSEICVSFVSRLRDTIAFGSLDELKATVNANIEWVRTHLS